jgi:hypothetical protein
MSHPLTFAAGFLCGAATWLLWQALRFAAEMRTARRQAAHYLDSEAVSECDRAARDAIQACKTRLRWQKRLNPEWLPPLADEIPRLVREIARIYHPDAPHPLLAPGLSQFSRAVELAAGDVSQFLSRHRVGRLVDVSAGTAWRTWEMGQKIAGHEAVKTAGRWWRRVLPVWQAVGYKSPLVWAGVAVSNVAARTLQPVIVDLIARRALELYGGKAASTELPSEELDGME